MDLFFLQKNLMETKKKNFHIQSISVRTLSSSLFSFPGGKISISLLRRRTHTSRLQIRRYILLPLFSSPLSLARSCPANASRIRKEKKKRSSWTIQEEVLILSHGHPATDPQNMGRESKRERKRERERED